MRAPGKGAEKEEEGTEGDVGAAADVCGKGKLEGDRLEALQVLFQGDGRTLPAPSLLDMSRVSSLTLITG